MVQVPEILYLWQLKEIAAICRVTLKTARNWKSGKVCPPATAIMVLSRDLGCFDSRWSGWTISLKGNLVSPENWIATPGDVLSIQLTQAQLAAYRHENKSLKAEIDAIEAERLGMDEQPTIDDWEISVG